MRILYHHRTQAEDAQGVHIEAMVQAFRDLGHEVDVVALVGESTSGGRQPRRGVWNLITRSVPRGVYELMQLVYNLHGYRVLSRSLQAQRYDAIYERYSLNTVCGIWASRRYRVPILLEVNAPLYLEERELGRLRFAWIAKRSERWICSNTTKTLVVSHVMSSLLASEGVPRDRMCVLPNGVDLDEFDPKVAGDRARRRHGLDGKCVIGFIGWIRPWHGVEMLLEAAHDVLTHEPAAHVLVIGDGPAMPDVRRTVERLGIQDHVTFAGPIARTAVPEHIAALDIAVQPHATAYASPMKLFEYMAMERCIVAPDQPNIREILEDGTSGVLFPARDRDGLAVVLRDLIRNPDRRLAMARGARRTLLERGFSWRSNAIRALELLRAGRS